MATEGTKTLTAAIGSSKKRVQQLENEVLGMVGNARE